MRKGIGRTNIGNVRTKNQDTIFVLNESIGNLSNLYIVADGMGGHKAGEVASSMAVEFFCSYTRQNALEAAAGMEAYLEEGVKYTNSKIFALSAGSNEWGGMGTTFSMVTIVDGLLYFAHVGDSRIYLVSSAEIKLISQDHSFVAEMVRKGQLTEEEARLHPNRNILTRSLGTDEKTAVDTGRCRIISNDRVLICSDGLSNMVPDSDIHEIMNRAVSDDEKADALIALALKNGGTDNVSLVMV